MTITGVTVRLSRDQVIRSLENVPPETIYKHAVEIESRRYSVKQAFACATGLDPLEFNTEQARRALKKLGFVVIRT